VPTDGPADTVTLKQGKRGKKKERTHWLKPELPKNRDPGFKRHVWKKRKRKAALHPRLRLFRKNPGGVQRWRGSRGGTRKVKKGGKKGGDCAHPPKSIMEKEHGPPPGYHTAPRREKRKRTTPYGQPSEKRGGGPTIHSSYAPNLGRDKPKTKRTEGGKKGFRTA